MELVIFTPCEISQKLLAKIKEKIEIGVKIRVKIDPSLIGGAAFAWKGQYKDYSLKARLEQHEEEIKKIYEGR